MPKTANPFKPTAGKMPPVLIDRRDIVESFVEGLNNGAGAPGRLMLLSGQRGFGKTVMLTELARVAGDLGWVVVMDSASEGLVDRLVASLQDVGPRLDRLNIAPSVGIPGLVNVSLGGVELGSRATSLTLREAIEKRLAKLPKGKGVVLAIDESQAASHDDLVAVATAYQQVLQDLDLTGDPDDEKRGIALVLAALPQLTDELLNDKVLTFLRRSQQHVLAEVPPLEVRDAYVKVARQSGKRISLDVAERAADFALGYPYMVQLVGYYMWQSSHRREADEITLEDVEQGATDAVKAFQDAVCAPTFDGLSMPQREFLRAMLPDLPDATRIVDIPKRTKKSMSWANKYRASLIADQVIVADGKGLVRLAIPHMGDYLKRESARLGY